MICLIIEYASTVWDPISTKNISKLEMVQIKASRFVVGGYQSTSSVTEIMATLKWPKLKDRSRKAKIAMLFEIIHDKIKIPARHLVPKTTM